MKSRRKKSLVGIVWTGWGNECKSSQWRTPSMYIIPTPKSGLPGISEDGIFICNILKKFAGKKVRVTISELGGR